MEALYTYISSFPPYLYKNVAPIMSSPPRHSVPDPNEKRFTLPRITKQDFKATLANYRRYAAIYNEKARDFNLFADKYNKKVKAHTAETPPSPRIVKLLQVFTENFGDYRNAEYNESAKGFNTLHGPYMPLRKLDILRDSSEKVFQSMLHEYQVHLSKITELWKKYRPNGLKTLPKAPINPQRIVQQQRDGVAAITLCKRTIRNHKRRLEDAGILIEREYHGTNICVDYFFNPSILVVSEAENNNLQSALKQLVNQSKRKNFQHKQSGSTRTSEKNEIRNVDKSNSRDKDFAPQSPFNDIYLNTKWQNEEKQTARAEKNVKKPTRAPIAPPGMVSLGQGMAQLLGSSNTNTQKRVPKLEKSKLQRAAEELVTKEELAKRISNGDYNYYPPMDFRILKEELRRNTVSDLDFWAICLQDFIKSAAKINRHDQAGENSWYMAIGYIERDFGCINFEGKPFDKIHVLERLRGFRYRLNWVLTQFERHKWQPLYASKYFDPLRTESNQVSWRYTEKIWKREAKRLIRAKRDKEHSRELKNLEQRIYAYLRKETTFKTLEAYVLRKSEAIQNAFPNKLETLTKRKLWKK